MADNIFENLTDEEQNNLWMYMIFNRDKIMAKTEQWTKEAEEADMTLTEYLESISPLNNKEKLSWLGKSCEDCGNEKCKKSGTLPKGYDCALWQEKEGSEGDVIYRQAAIDALESTKTAISESGERYIAKQNAIMRIDALPPAQPTEASCWGCNCQKMEGLKEQKTFSEMVHLHDAETHDKRTKTHACDCISRQAVIELVKHSYYDLSSSPEATEEMVADVKKLPSAQPFHNITMNDVLKYIDGMPEDVWQEFTACLECRGWELQRRTAKWCGSEFE